MMDMVQEPHLLNLNEDKLMSEKLFHFLNIGWTRRCSSTIVGGLGTLKEHCTIEHLPSTRYVDNRRLSMVKWI